MNNTQKIVNLLPQEELTVTLEDHHSAIVESSRDAIISKNLDGIIQSWNPAAERIFGYSPLEAIGQPITILIPQSHQNEEPQILARIRNGQTIEYYETVRQRKDKQLIHVGLTISPIRTANGNVIGASKIVRDLGPSRKTLDLELRLAAIVDSSDDAILSKDLNGIIQSWNSGAEKIFGYTAVETIGKSVTMLIPEGHRDEEPNILGRIRNGEKIDHYETIRQRKDGSLVNISLTVSPIKDQTGKIIGASKIARDITAQKRAEREIRNSQAALKQLNDELERRVSTRTASLNEALAQMEEFSYSISHDLRSPSRAMEAYANAVIEDYGHLIDQRGLGLLQKIVRGSARMDKLIRDLLDYSRISRIEIDLHPIELGAVIRDIIEQYPEMQSPRAQIKIASHLDAVIANDSALTQVLSNLLSNSVKFVTPGVTPVTQVRTERRGDKVRLWIQDNGIGIKPEFQSRIFGVFERLSHDSPYEGTGIGLAIVKKAVEKMNGAVGVESDGLNGSSFWVDLSAKNN